MRCGHSLSCLPSCARLHRAAVERQLLDRGSDLRVGSLPSSFTVPLRGLLGVDRAARGESRLRRRSCRMAAIMGSKVLRGGPAARKLSEKLVWRTRASSVDIGRPTRSISSSTASPQRPHTHHPLNRPRTASTYAGVHSSVSPQHSHTADTTSGLASPPRTSSDITQKSYLSPPCSPRQPRTEPRKRRSRDGSSSSHCDRLRCYGRWHCRGPQASLSRPTSPWRCETGS
ncbi:hypothetical protein GW17_00056146 [Ensete ventricosum]|nr:hypothetical protein GW17_00056146 [Ensete ventricosum]